MKTRKRAASGLVLVGTVHHDPRGYDILLRALAVLQPDIITLELSPYGRGFRTKYSRKLSQRILSAVPAMPERETGPCAASSGEHLLPAAIEQLLASVTFPFEYRAVRDYAAACRVPFYCIDLSRVSRKKLRMLKAEALTGHNIKTLLSLPDKDLPDSVNLCYKRAAAAWHEQCTRRQLYPAADPSIIERDEHMSRRLRNLVQIFPGKTIVHIAGWEHCAEGCSANLCGLLKDLGPRRFLLDNAWTENRPVPES